MKKRRALRIILAVCIVGLTVFIFSNSLTVGAESAEQSGRITKIVEAVLDSLFGEGQRENLGKIVRKLGHFSEYFALSAVFAPFVLTFTKKKRFAWTSIPYCGIVAVCDEFICQRITEGRGPSWTDVLIDLSGALCALLLILGILVVVGKRKKKKI